MRDPVRGVGEALVAFIPRFNDKLASLFPSSPEKVGTLTKSQVRTLMLLLGHPGFTATELGECLNMTKANLTVILDELESKGLAQRTTDLEDRRKLRLGLTGEGRKMADAIALEFKKALGERIAPLSAKDRETLARSLAAATSILEKL